MLLVCCFVFNMMMMLWEYLWMHAFLEDGCEHASVTHCDANDLNYLMFNQCQLQTNEVSRDKVRIRTGKKCVNEFLLNHVGLFNMVKQGFSGIQ
jgi:hypothetical protein